MYLVEEETKLAKLRVSAGLLYKNLIEFLSDIKDLSKSQHLDFLLEDAKLREVMLSIQSEKPDYSILEETEVVILLLARFHSMSVYDHLKDYKPEPEVSVESTNKKSLDLLSVSR